MPLVELMRDFASVLYGWTVAKGALPRRVPQVPPDPRSHPPTGGFSPDLTFGSAEHLATEELSRYVRAHKRGTFLDVGGRRGERRSLAGPLDYSILDLEPRRVPGATVIAGDICACPEIPEGSFDVIFSNNVFEHLVEPWSAAAEIGRILKPGGLSICLTVFAWRYHPVPVDYWRFTHTGLGSLFEHQAGLETLQSGFDLCARRDNKVGGKIAGGLDVAPVDELGGWRENWSVFHIGRKPEHAARVSRNGSS